jgi:hypothetical protein
MCMAEYRQTHVVPTEGLPAWAGPDGSAAPAANLDPGLDVMLLERRGDWAQVRCSNGWEAWVDARRLVVSAPAPAAAPAPAPPPPAAPAPPQTAPAPPETAPTSTTAPPPSPTQTAPPSAVWGASGAVAGAPRAVGGFRIGVGEILALVGSFIVVVSTWFNWVGRDNFHRSAYKMPAHFLLDSTSGDGGLNLGIVVLIIGVMGIAFALMPGPRALRVGDIAVGGVALLIALLFIWQVKELSAHPLVSVSTLGLLDVGPFIAIVGAGLVAVGGVLSLLKKS